MLFILFFKYNQWMSSCLYKTHVQNSKMQDQIPHFHIQDLPSETVGIGSRAFDLLHFFSSRNNICGLPPLRGTLSLPLSRFSVAGSNKSWISTAAQKVLSCGVSPILQSAAPPLRKHKLIPKASVAKRSRNDKYFHRKLRSSWLYLQPFHYISFSWSLLASVGPCPPPTPSPPPLLPSLGVTQPCWPSPRFNQTSVSLRRYSLSVTLPRCPRCPASSRIDVCTKRVCLRL